MVDVDFAFSKGDWKFDGDAKGDYLEQEYNEDGQIIGQMTTEYVYMLKVGDIHKLVGGLTLKPIKGLNIQGLLKVYVGGLTLKPIKGLNIQGLLNMSMMTITVSTMGMVINFT